MMTTFKETLVVILQSGPGYGNFLLRPSTFFGSTSRPTISRFRERFRDDQYGLVSFLFAVLLITVPPPSPVPSHL